MGEHPYIVACGILPSYRRALLDPGITAFLCYARTYESFPHSGRIFAALRGVIASALGWRCAMLNLIVALRIGIGRAK